MLRVLAKIHESSGRKSVICKCDCGNYILREYSVVTCGYSKSCGCRKGKFYGFEFTGEQEYTVTDDDIKCMDAIVSQLDNGLKVPSNIKKSFSQEDLLGIAKSEDTVSEVSKPSITMSVLLNKYRTPQVSVEDDLGDKEQDCEIDEFKELVSSNWVTDELSRVDIEEGSFANDGEVVESELQDTDEDGGNSMGIEDIEQYETIEKSVVEEPVVSDVIQRSFSVLAEISKGIQKVTIKGYSVDEQFLKDNGFRRTDVSIAINTISDFLGGFSSSDLDTVVKCALGVGDMDCYVRFESHDEKQITSLCLIIDDEDDCLNSSVTIYSKNTNSVAVNKLMEVLVCL